MISKENQQPILSYSNDCGLDGDLVQRIEELLVEDYKQRQSKKDSRFFPNQQMDDQQNYRSQQSIEQILTNGEILDQVLQDVNIRKTVHDDLASQGINNPVIYLDIISLDDQEFELDYDDIYETFIRFGHILHLIVRQKRVIIFFNNMVSAFFAKKCNDDFYIDELNVKMKLDFTDLEESLSNNAQILNLIGKVYQKQIVIPKDCNSSKDSEHWNSSMVDYQKTSNQKNSSTSIHKNTTTNKTSRNTNTNNHRQPEQPKYNNHASLKYTCKYEILIQPDKYFQVPRKIIGSKGVNMKRIIEKCAQNNQQKDQDAVKLRLRGKGSGYKEGPNKKESSENLHLCVSSKYYESYQLACQLVQNLLDNIYTEYVRFVKKRNLNNSLQKAYQKVESQQNPKAVKTATNGYQNE